MNALRLFFEDLANDWDANQPQNRDEILNLLIATFDDLLTSCNTILEVGTGTGALIPILKGRYPSSDLVSVDLAHRMLEKGQARIPNAHLVQADAHHLPFVDSGFDAIVCHNAFPHFWWPETALQTFRKLLTPNGILLILHDLSRERVNNIHGTAQNPIIHRDLLPAGDDLALMMEKGGFSPLLVEDRYDRYVIYAKVN